MAERSRVLFLRPFSGVGASFVRVDEELLARHFALTPMAADLSDPLLGARLLKAALGHDICFAWFADAHAYHAVNAFALLGKPAMVVPGQYEFACEPEAGYGLQLEHRGRWRKGSSALRRAGRVLAVSDYHRGTLLAAGAVAATTERVYHGFDGRAFAAGSKQPLVVTIAHMATWQRVWHKGLETFARAAPEVDDARFIIAGDYSPEVADHLQQLAAGSLELTGGLSQPEVGKLLGRAHVYAQLSAMETFGCALAEAMLCECVPVVTTRGSLPEVTGELGLRVEYGDVAGTVAAIRQALTSDQGAACRERIVREFPLERREEQLVAAVHALLHRPRAVPGALAGP